MSTTFETPFQQMSDARERAFLGRVSSAEFRRDQTFSSDRDMADVQSGDVVYPYFADTETVRHNRDQILDTHGQLPAEYIEDFGGLE